MLILQMLNVRLIRTGSICLDQSIRTCEKIFKSQTQWNKAIIYEKMKWRCAFLRLLQKFVLQRKKSNMNIHWKKTVSYCSVRELCCQTAAFLHAKLTCGEGEGEHCINAVLCIRPHYTHTHTRIHQSWAQLVLCDECCCVFHPLWRKKLYTAQGPQMLYLEGEALSSPSFHVHLYEFLSSLLCAWISLFPSVTTSCCPRESIVGKATEWRTLALGESTVDDACCVKHKGCVTLMWYWTMEPISIYWSESQPFGILVLVLSSNCSLTASQLSDETSSTKQSLCLKKYTFSLIGIKPASCLTTRMLGKVVFIYFPFFHSWNNGIPQEVFFVTGTYTNYLLIFYKEALLCSTPS